MSKAVSRDLMTLKLDADAGNDCLQAMLTCQVRHTQCHTGNLVFGRAGLDGEDGLPEQASLKCNCKLIQLCMLIEVFRWSPYRHH